MADKDAPATPEKSGSSRSDKVSVQISRATHEKISAQADKRGYGVGKLIDRAVEKYAQELASAEPLP